MVENKKILAGIVGTLVATAAGASPLEIGTRLEPFFDNFLIAETQNVSLTLGVPQWEEVVLHFDEPWEGDFAGYVTVIKDGEKYRMYYRGLPTDKSPCVTCYAESIDGRNWVKPHLGLYPYQGHNDTNIIIANKEHISSDFCPFLDENPKAMPAERFKAVGGTGRTGLYPERFKAVGGTGLYALTSSDGINWRLLYDKPVFVEGAFDSQNAPFWSETEGIYVLYFRVFTGGGSKGFRTIARTTSMDFSHWTKPELMTFGATPMEHLYTNQTHPYYRAKHIYLSFPMRFVPDRSLLTADEARKLDVFPGRESAISDGVFMTSRGGTAYQRTFLAALFRPGLDRNMWVARNSMVALGVVPLQGGGMGLYLQRHYAAPTNHLVLYSVREDGLASLKGGAIVGYVVTKPFKQRGTGLWLNYSTSAAGSVLVEVLNEDGKDIEGYSKKDGVRIFGDSLSQEIIWKNNASWTQLGGETIRLRISLQDADLYSIQQR